MRSAPHACLHTPPSTQRSIDVLVAFVAVVVLMVCGMVTGSGNGGGGGSGRHGFGRAFHTGLDEPRVEFFKESGAKLNYTWPIKQSVNVHGDVMLGGLMMVHEREDTQTCGPIMPQGGIQALECMLYTLDIVNRRENFLNGFTLGAYILDDCDKDTYGLEQAVDFIKGSIKNLHGSNKKCQEDGRDNLVISGVIGAASSVTSIQVANLLRLFRIPQVSFFSTSPELSNKQRFEYFLRTVPSDKNQAEAMVKIVTKLNWTYVSILYEESNYGNKAFSVLEERLSHHNVCIAVKEKLIKDSGVLDESAYDNIVRKLYSKPRARGVIIFGSDQEVAGVMRGVKRLNLTGHFLWIGSDGWSARSLVSDGNEPQVEGTLSVQPRAKPVQGFDEYFLSLTVKNNRRNPWFPEFWEHYFKCKWPNGIITPYNQNYTRNCTGDERVTRENGYEAERQLQFVADAVLAFANAIREMRDDKCGSIQGLCDVMKPIDGQELLKYLRKVEFQGINNDTVRFSEDGDGPARYNILHFKQTAPGVYKWIQVGTYDDGELDLDMRRVQFRMGKLPSFHNSTCSDECAFKHAKKILEGESCCWTCIECGNYDIVAPNGLACIECAAGKKPDPTHQRCIDIPEVYMSPNSMWATGVMAFASAGVFVTVGVIYVFVKYNDTPVVRASGRELSYVLLFGIFLCYGMTFILVQRPTDIVCGIQKAGVGFCFTIVYAAILTKNNRIARIFRAGKRTTKRPSFISPKSQLVICGSLVSVQLMITCVWLITSRPKAVHDYPSREQNHLVCEASISASYIVGFTYPMFLVVICTIYAIITRKIPEAFNESKYIGFTMYTTCIIWLSFVPIYFTTSKHAELNITTMCASISLSATVTLVCLFTPKLYIILLHPEKNVRQSMMPHNKYGTLKNHTSVSSSTTRVESATQSDDFEMSFKHRSAMSLVSNNSRASCATQTEEEDEAEDESDRDDRSRPNHHWLDHKDVQL